MFLTEFTSPYNLNTQRRWHTSESVTVYKQRRVCFQPNKNCQGQLQTPQSRSLCGIHRDSLWSEASYRCKSNGLNKQSMKISSTSLFKCVDIPKYQLIKLYPPRKHKIRSCYVESTVIYYGMKCLIGAKGMV